MLIHKKHICIMGYYISKSYCSIGYAHSIKKYSLFKHEKSGNLVCITKSYDEWLVILGCSVSNLLIHNKVKSKLGYYLNKEYCLNEYNKSNRMITLYTIVNDNIQSITKSYDEWLILLGSDNITRFLSKGSMLKGYYINYKSCSEKVYNLSKYTLYRKDNGIVTTHTKSIENWKSKIGTGFYKMLSGAGKSSKGWYISV